MCFARVLKYKPAFKSVELSMAVAAIVAKYESTEENVWRTT